MFWINHFYFGYKMKETSKFFHHRFRVVLKMFGLVYAYPSTPLHRLSYIYIDSYERRMFKYYRSRRLVE